MGAADGPRAATTPILYTAVKRFPAANRGWGSYFDGRDFRALREIVSLDSVLCGEVISGLIPEDWGHNWHEDSCHELFRDLAYLQRRIAGAVDYQILAVMREPTEASMAAFTDPRFSFIGFDLMDDAMGQSVLTNCGQIPELFADRELSEYGLLTDLGRARAVRAAARDKFPDDMHLSAAQVWAVWRMK